MGPQELEPFITTLVDLPKFQQLWSVDDRGVPVFVHTVDVVLLSIDAYPTWLRKHPRIDLPTVVVGALLHDLSKASTKVTYGCSHSRLMSSNPQVAVAEAASVIAQAEANSGLVLDSSQIRNVKHVVESHHGPYGKIRPETPEAALVHKSDLYSATHHRFAPVDANDILPLLERGCRWPQAGAILGVGRDVVRKRLVESCRAENVSDWTDLLPVWRSNGRVSVGPPEREAKHQRVRDLLRWSREAPDSLFVKLRPLLSSGN